MPSPVYSILNMQRTEAQLCVLICGKAWKDHCVSFTDKKSETQKEQRTL